MSVAGQHLSQFHLLPLLGGRGDPSQSGLPGRLVLGLLAFMGLDASAQIALQNAVTTDRGIEARRLASEASLSDQPGGEAGPVQFSAEFSYSFAFNDNVNYSESDAAGDLIQTPAVSIDLAVPITQRSALGFRVGIGYQAYWHNEDLSRWQLSPDSEIAYDLQVKDAYFTVFNRFTYSQDVYNQPSVANSATFPQFQNTAGLQVTWNPYDYVVAGGYSYQLVRSGSDENRQIDSGSHLLFGRLGHLYAEGAINTGVEISVTFTDYLQSTNSDSTVVSLGPYLEWELSEALDLQLRGGYAFYTFSTVQSPDQSTDENTFYLGLDARHQLTDYIFHQLVVTHGVAPGAEQNVAFVVQTDIGYLLSYAFVENALLDLGVNFVHGEQSESVGGGSETFDQFRLRTGARWSLSTRIRLDLAYELFIRDSNLLGRSYTANQITLGGGYTF